MAYVNYIREHLAFMEYACDEGLTANERLLWYALFHVMNGKSKGDDWPEGLIPITHKRLLALVPFGEDSLVAARNKLKQRGIIDFRPGKKNAAAPMYRLCYFCAELSTENPQKPDFYPKLSGNVRGNSRGNVRGNVRGNDGGESPDNIINYKPKRNAQDEVVDAAADRRAREVQDRITRTYREQVGRDTMPAEMRMLFEWASEMNADIIEQAIGRAACAGARSPAAYAVELLRAWRDKGVATVYDLVCLDRDGHVMTEEG